MRLCALNLLVTVVLIGCVGDAPRDNPLDPFAPNYDNKGSVSGRLVIENQTNGVAGAVISALDDSLTVITDSIGYFSFSTLSGGAHRFVSTKENYTNDTFHVNIIPNSSIYIIRWLNGAPVVLLQTILTRKIDHVSFAPKYYVDVTAEVTDPNGIIDIDSVWFNVADTIFFPMTYSISLKKFFVTLDKSKFPTNTIQWLTGKALHIVSRDKHLATNFSQPFFVTRIIENQSTPLSPSQFQNVDPDTLVFKWKPPDITFAYTSTVAIYESGTENLVWSYSGRISFYEHLPLPANVVLQPENYFWTVSIVDEFGNFSQSQESYFVVP